MLKILPPGDVRKTFQQKQIVVKKLHVEQPVWNIRPLQRFSKLLMSGQTGREDDESRL